METELLHTLANALATGAFGAAGAGLYSYFAAKVKALLGSRPPEEVARSVADFGKLSPGRIRQVVQAQLVDKGKLADSKREELVALLINFAHGARLATSEGTLIGSSGNRRTVRANSPDSSPHSANPKRRSSREHEKAP